MAVRRLLPTNMAQSPSMEGNVFAAAAFPVWSIYRITPHGVATYLGYSFRSGGNTAILQRSADRTIEADDGPYIQQVEGNRLVSTAGFNDVPGIAKFNFLDYFALRPMAQSTPTTFLRRPSTPTNRLSPSLLRAVKAHHCGTGHRSTS